MDSPTGTLAVEYSETVPFCDTDCGGVVSNIAYLRYVEKARILLFEALGLPAISMVESGLFPAVVRTEIDYRSPARLGETVRVGARLGRVEKARLQCRFELTASAATEGPRVVAAAVQTVALLLMPSARPQRIPAEWLRLGE